MKKKNKILIGLLVLGGLFVLCLVFGIMIASNSDESPSVTSTVVTKVGTIVTPSPVFGVYPDCVSNLSSMEQGVVTRIVDGDTVDVNINGETFTVRYIGVNTPETNEINGDKATEVNTLIVLNKNVTLFKDVSNTDMYDRLLRYVFVNDIFVNDYLVKEGWATSAEYSPDTSCKDLFIGSQETAKTLAVGMWKTLPTTIAPIQTNAENCDASYPTVCIPPAPPDLNCGDVSYRNFKVIAPDPHGFDSNNDGIGCVE